MSVRPALPGSVAGIRAGRREWVSLAVLALPTLLVSMDLTVLHLAVPELSIELQPSSSQLLWIVDIYGFMIAGSLITMGTLGDRIGRRRLLLIGATAFGIASVLAAFSSSAEMLIAMRALLGVAAATLMPSTLALIRNMFVDSRQRAVAIAVWVAVFSTGTAIGPVLGGVLLNQFWWGSVFLLGVPVTLVLMAVGPTLLPEYRDPDAGRLDVTSAALSLAAVLAVIYGLKQIAEHGVGSVSVLSIVAGLVLGAVFLRRQRVLANPLIDLRLFRNRAFSTSLSAETLALFAWVGTFLFLAQYLQLVVGMSPLRAGLWMLPAAGGSILGSMLAPAFARRVRPAYVMGAGLALAAVGFVALAQIDEASGLAIFVLGTIITSFGIAPTVALSTDIIVGAAPAEQAGAASAIAETGSELGLALGVAIIGSIGTATYRNEVADAIPSGASLEATEAARDTLGGAISLAQQLPGRAGDALLDAAQEAFIQGMRVSAIVSAGVAVCVAILATALVRRVQAESEAEGQPISERHVAPGVQRAPCFAAVPTDVAAMAWRTATSRSGGDGSNAVPLTSLHHGSKEKTAMSLKEYRVVASIAVSDMGRARQFYEGKLGLADGVDGADGSRVYVCEGNTSLHVYPSPSSAGKTAGTLATWHVAELEPVVDDLTAAGVTFERYSRPELQTDARGIHVMDDGKVAWFKDPDGNTFAIEQ